MDWYATKLNEVKVLIPVLLEDDRGFFFEAYNQEKFNSIVGEKINFVQDNHSKSSFGVLRGLHFQKKPFAQAKLVRVVRGEIFDVAVDVRKNSSTYGHWVGEYLSENNKKQLWIPEGFAHGFLTLSDNAEVIYKTNNFYNKESEVILYPFDNNLKIQWPKLKQKVTMSDKDARGINFRDFNE